MVLWSFKVQNASQKLQSPANSGSQEIPGAMKKQSAGRSHGILMLDGLPGSPWGIPPYPIHDKSTYSAPDSGSFIIGTMLIMTYASFKI